MMDRRTALTILGLGACTSSLSGCLAGVTGSGAQDTPTPVDLSGTKADDRGGMVIGDHGGPNGQIFYRNNSPEGHENPAWFHTLTFGLFPYYFEHKDEGWEATVIYVTDYSSFDYTVSRNGGRRTISAPTAPETFAEATGLTYVIESKVSGGMGPALLPFSVSDDARSFIDEYGGQTIRFDQLTPVFISNYSSKNDSQNTS